MRGLGIATIAAIGAAAVVAAVSGLLPKHAGTPAPLRADDPPVAVFAGGDPQFLQAVFERVYGVITVVPGTSAADAAGSRVDAVEVSWDPGRVTYGALLDAYWRYTDPTDGGGQFSDRGLQFRPVVFFHDERQRAEAEASRTALAGSGRFKAPIVTEILPEEPFSPAGDPSQGLANGGPGAFQSYLVSSGRAGFMTKAWGPDALVDPDAPRAPSGAWHKPSAVELAKQLTALQFEVTQHDGTEPPFHNDYWDNHGAGIYVDVVSGEPLFSSTDKYDSNTGWPSFTRPLAPGNIVLKVDRSFGMERTEVRSRYAGSHLGHLFTDGPPPTGLRYCMDSAALRFVSVADMQREGYGRYLKLFPGSAGQ